MPSRDELYARVDEDFRVEFPDAPARLHATSAEHADWRREWLVIRDDLLNAEVNRLYWDRYPGAPHQIDPENPAHREFQEGWWEIRTEILANAPEPADGGDGPAADEPDFSFARAGIYQAVVSLQEALPPSMKDPLDVYVETAYEQAQSAVLDGSATKTAWWGPETAITAPDEELTVTFQVWALKITRTSRPVS